MKKTKENVDNLKAAKNGLCEDWMVGALQHIHECECAGPLAIFESKVNKCIDRMINNHAAIVNDIISDPNKTYAEVKALKEDKAALIKAIAAHADYKNRKDRESEEDAAHMKSRIESTKVSAGLKLSDETEAAFKNAIAALLEEHEVLALRDSLYDEVDWYMDGNWTGQINRGKKKMMLEKDNHPDAFNDLDNLKADEAIAKLNDPKEVIERLMAADSYKNMAQKKQELLGK